MNPFTLLRLLAAGVCALVFASCASKAPKLGPNGQVIQKKPENYKEFLAQPKYPKFYDVWKNEDVLSRTNASNSKIVISLSKQRGFLMNGDDVAIDYPICSGRATHPTPTGTFKISEKVVDKRSNRYGRIYDATGNVAFGDADITTDVVPEGGRFEGAAMRYWMRLTGDGVGHHIGPVKRYPASHACIRGPSAVMPIVYSKVKLGTPITVER